MKGSRKQKARFLVMKLFWKLTPKVMVNDRNCLRLMATEMKTGRQILFQDKFEHYIPVKFLT